MEGIRHKSSNLYSFFRCSFTHWSLDRTELGREVQLGMSGSPLERLITEARRRSVFNLVFEQSIQAFGISLAVTILLLITGTQILSWIWPVLLFVLALGYGIYRIRTRVPDSYQVAQKIDHDLFLKDTLSTAWHFRNTDEDVFSRDVKAVQRAQAEQQAAEIEPATAVPYEYPRSLRWASILLFCVLGLFFARYGVQQTLDLSQPLIALNLGSSFSETRDPEKKAASIKTPSPVENLLKNISVQPPDQAESPTPDLPPVEGLKTVNVPDADNSNSLSTNEQGNEKGNQTAESGEVPENAEQGEGLSTGKSDNQESGKGAGPESQNNQNAKNQTPPQPGEKSSLLDKMKDALSNMMSKMNPQQNQQGDQQQQSAENSKDSQPSGNARQQQSKSGQKKGQQSSDEQQQASNQQGDQDMQEADPSQTAQGKSGDQSSQQASSQSSKSGMGEQDGDKDVKIAEQLSAMGKISEIIGKRNEKLQGEMMVEVNSSRQNLKTQYSDQNVSHSSSGGEIRRDEIPLIYQNYVQQYFEEVRKTAPAGKNSSSGKK